MKITAELARNWTGDEAGWRWEAGDAGDLLPLDCQVSGPGKAPDCCLYSAHSWEENQT